MSKVRRLSKSALRSLGNGLARLDELGGDARDRILEWLDESPTAARVKEIIARRREARDQEVAVAVAADAAARQASAATAPIPEPPPAEPLGDASVPAQIYGKRSCPWSGRAVRLFEDRGVEHSFVDLDDSENEVLHNRLIAETRQNTVPYIFVRGEFIGGFNALSERDRLGQLDALLEPDPDPDRPGRIVVEVAERDNTDEVAPAERKDLN